MQTFLRSLGERERNLLAPLISRGDVNIAEYIQSRRQDLFDVLRECNAPALPTVDQARSMVINIARHTLLEVPAAAITAIRARFHIVNGNFFSGVTEAMMSRWYEQQSCPVLEEIISGLQLESKEEGSKMVFNVLIDFLREHRDDEDLLRRFLYWIHKRQR